MYPSIFSIGIQKRLARSWKSFCSCSNKTVRQSKEWPLSEHCLIGLEQLGRNASVLCEHTLESVRSGLVYSWLEMFHQLRWIIQFRCQLFFSGTYISRSSTCWDRMNSRKIYFLFFYLFPDRYWLSSHKVHVMPHQNSGTWAAWSGSTFSFILVPHCFATRCPNFHFCAISRHLCWWIPGRPFHASSFALLIFLLWSYVSTLWDYFIAKNLDIKVESP